MTRQAVDPPGESRSWWMLVHQLPPSPPGLRVRVWRRLQAIGALQWKGSVYLMPDGDAHRESLEWLLREIEAGGAEATLFRATLEAGATDEECVGRFRAQVEAEYGALRSELLTLGRPARGRRRAVSDERREGRGDERGAELARLRIRLAAIERRDFFGAGGREAVAALLARHEQPTEGTGMAKRRAAAKTHRGALVGKTWTTRAGVHVDRMASAWLVLRFVDPAARFRFVAATTIAAAPGEIRFDTFGGEFTHEDERCTFEVLLGRLGLEAPGLARIGEIVHDLDLQDDRYGRPETAGVEAAIEGIAASTAGDLERIERGCVLFDALLARFARGG